MPSPRLGPTAARRDAQLPHAPEPSATEPAAPAGGPVAPHAALLEFFKALADANRLRLVGVLAHEPRSVEDLAAVLELDSSTVSHHLARLARVGLVHARADGPYSVYSLDREALQTLARELLADDALPRLAGDADLDAFERKVLGTFVDEEGRFTAFPKQQKKYLVLVRHTLDALEPGAVYSEAEVNERLARFNDDTARLRRSLVDFGFMRRDRDGGRYWLVEGAGEGAASGSATNG